MSAPAVKSAPKKVTKPKMPADHPKYTEMITAAINAMKDRKGTSRQAIDKYIRANYKVGDSIHVHVKMALRKMVKTGILKQRKGVGASGSFSVGESAKNVKKAKKPKTVTVKPKQPKATKPKAAGAKKATKSKKPKSPKKAAVKPKTAKKSPAKKSPAKKSPAKKSPAKKAVESKAKKTSKKPAVK